MVQSVTDWQAMACDFTKKCWFRVRVHDQTKSPRQTFMVPDACVHNSAHNNDNKGKLAF